MADSNDKHDRISGKNYTKFTSNFQRLLTGVNDARKSDNTRLDALEKLIHWIAVVHFHGLPKPLFQQVIRALFTTLPAMPLVFVEEWQAMFDCLDLSLYRVKSLGYDYMDLFWKAVIVLSERGNALVEATKGASTTEGKVLRPLFVTSSIIINLHGPEKLIEMISEHDAFMQNNPLCIELIIKMLTRAVLCLPQHGFSAYLTVKMLIHCALLRPLSILRRAGLEGIKALYVAKTGCDDVVELNSAIRALSVGEGKAYKAVVCRIKRDERPKVDSRFQIIHWWLDRNDYGEDASWIREPGDEYLSRCVRENQYWGTSSAPSAPTVASAARMEKLGHGDQVKEEAPRKTTGRKQSRKRKPPPEVVAPPPGSTHTSSASLSTYVVEADQVDTPRPKKPTATNARTRTDSQHRPSSPHENHAIATPVSNGRRENVITTSQQSAGPDAAADLMAGKAGKVKSRRRQIAGVPKDPENTQTESQLIESNTTQVTRSLPVLAMPLATSHNSQDPADVRRSEASFVTSHTARVHNPAPGGDVHLPLITSLSDKIILKTGFQPARLHDGPEMSQAKQVLYRAVSPQTVLNKSSSNEKKISTLMEKLRNTSGDSASSWSTSELAEPATTSNHQALLLQTLNRTHRIEPHFPVPDVCSMASSNGSSSYKDPATEDFHQYNTKPSGLQQFKEHERSITECSSTASLAKEASTIDSFYLAAAQPGVRRTSTETHVTAMHGPSFNTALFAETETETCESIPKAPPKEKLPKPSPVETIQGKKPEEVRVELQMLLDRMQRGARHSGDIVLAIDEFVRLTKNYPRVVENAIGLVFSQFLPLVCSLNSHVAAEAVAALELLMPAVESKLHLVASQVVEALCNNLQNARTSDHSKKVFNQFLALQSDRAGALLPPLSSHIGTMMKKNKKEAFAFVTAKYAETLRRAFPKQPKNQAAAVQILQFVKSVLVWITNYGEVNSSTKPEVQAVDILIQESVKAFGLDMLNKVCFDYRDTVKLFLSRHNQTAAVPAVASCGPTLQKVIVRRSSLMAFKKRLK